MLDLKHHLLVTAAAAVLLGTLAAPAAVAHGGTTHLQVTGHDEGGDFWFEFDGFDGKNPDIVLAPGSEYEVTFSVEAPAEQSHNFHAGGPVDNATDLIGPEDDPVTLNFTVPSDAGYPFDYWCDPHKSQGMMGQAYASTDDFPGDGDGGENGSPGFTAVAALGALGAAVALFDRRD